MGKQAPKKDVDDALYAASDLLLAVDAAVADRTTYPTECMTRCMARLRDTLNPVRARARLQPLRLLSEKKEP